MQTRPAYMSHMKLINLSGGMSDAMESPSTELYLDSDLSVWMDQWVRFVLTLSVSVLLTLRKYYFHDHLSVCLFVCLLQDYVNTSLGFSTRKSEDMLW